MELIKNVWLYAGDNCYLLILVWAVGAMMLPLGIKAYKESKLAIVIYIIYVLLICVVETVFWWCYFLDKFNKSL